jgi:hypothetical protein
MKKRKCPESEDIESERTLYTNFVTAANSVSQLYALASSQRKQAQEQGERAALERVLNIIYKLSDNGTAESVSTRSLVELISQDLHTARRVGQLTALPQFPVAPNEGGLKAYSSEEDEMNITGGEAALGTGLRHSTSRRSLGVLMDQDQQLFEHQQFLHMMPTLNNEATHKF